MTEEEMDKMAEEMAKMPGAPKPIKLRVCYDETLQKITGAAEEPVIMGEGATFLYLLQNVFMAHPEIEKQYPPGAVGFVINGTSPKPHSPLFDGDIVEFSIPQPCR